MRKKLRINNKVLFIDSITSISFNYAKLTFSINLINGSYFRWFLDKKNELDNLHGLLKEIEPYVNLGIRYIPLNNIVYYEIDKENEIISIMTRDGNTHKGSFKRNNVEKVIKQLEAV